MAEEKTDKTPRVYKGTEGVSMATRVWALNNLSEERRQGHSAEELLGDAALFQRVLGDAIAEDVLLVQAAKELDELRKRGLVADRDPAKSWTDAENEKKRTPPSSELGC